MTPKIPSHITDFIHRHHVVSLACYAENNLWAASCFYIFEPENNRLIILTKKTTHHGVLMLKNATVAGTIAGQPDTLSAIEGIQFTATAHCLISDSEKKRALTAYYQRYPIAKLMLSDVWEIKFDEIKHTENKVTFAKKSMWKRNLDSREI